MGGNGPRHGPPWPALAVAGAVVTALSGFLPWVSTGLTRRSGYGFAVTVDRFDLAPPGPLRLLVVVVPALPLLASVAAIATFVGRERVEAAVAAAGGITGILGAVGVVLAPVRSEYGAWVALLSGLVTLVTAALAGATVRRAR